MKKLPLTILTLLSIALITMGIYQEVFYYKFVFIGNGLSKPVSYIAGISLSLLLIYFTYIKAYVRFSILLLFSVVCSVIGQNHSYTEKQNSYSMHTVQKHELSISKQYYVDQIKIIDEQIQYNNSILPDNAKDRAMYKTNGVDPIKNDIALLESKKAEYESKMESASNRLSTGIKENTAFENISKDIPLLSSNVLKYGFQAILSLFIALMAPSGIRILSTIYPQGDKVVKKKEAKATGDDIYTRYVNSRFRGQEKPDTLKGRGGVVEEARISYNNFNKLAKLEKDLNLVTKEGNSTIPNVSKSEFIMMLRNKRVYKGCMTVVQ